MMICNKQSSHGLYYFDLLLVKWSLSKSVSDHQIGSG